MTKTLTKLSFGDRYKIYDHMKGVCFVRPDGVHCDYEKGWSDDDIVAWAHKNGVLDANRGHVKTIRQEMIGKLYSGGVTKSGSTADPDIVARVKDLELKLEQVIEKVRENNARLDEAIERLNNLYPRAA